MSASMNGITISGRTSFGSAAPPPGYLSIRVAGRTRDLGILYVEMTPDTIGAWVAGAPPSVSLEQFLTVPNDLSWHYSSYIYVVCGESYAQGIRDSAVGLTSFLPYSNTTWTPHSGPEVPTGFGTGYLRTTNQSNNLSIKWFIV